MDEAADIAAAAGVPADIMTMIAGSEDPQSIAAALQAGRGVVLLHKETDFEGHFFALVPRLGGQQIEVFDPLGGGSGVVYTYLRGKPGTDLNGTPPNWLGQLLDEMRGDGYQIGFNAAGPQRKDSNTCLLHCLARIGAPDLMPAEYTRRTKHAFS